MATFIAIVRSDRGSGYTASFPDFPGCAAAAPTLDHVLAKAKEALVIQIERLLKMDQRICTASAADTIEREDALLLAAIEVPDDLAMSNIELEMPALSLARIDSFAMRRGLTREALFVQAVDHWALSETLLPERRREIPAGPLLFDFQNPLELKVETSGIESLEEAAKRDARPQISDAGSSEDIAAELARLFDEPPRSQSSGGVQDAQARPAPEAD